MQIHQRMDCDDSLPSADHHPIKPISNENNNLLQKRSKFTKTKRAFGTNITNQSRANPNPPINTVTKNSGKPTKNNGFNFTKTQTKPGEQSQPQIPEKITKASGETDSSDEISIVTDNTLREWDAMDIENDLCVIDYVNDIIGHLREDETKNRNGCIIADNLDFMSKQRDVNARMRSVLVDWLVEVHRKFKLLPNTYFLGINILDRYLANAQLHRRKLQLCGCTALWIASKYHEIYAPEMDDFIYISDNAFTDSDLITMEIEILKVLGFTLTVPTVYNYTQRYTRISSFYLKKKKEMKIISDLIMYLVEHCVMCYNLCRLKPSLLAGAAFVYACIATKVFSVETFKKDKIEEVIGYTMDELREAMVEMDGIARGVKKSKHKAVLKKYSNAKYSNVGKLNFSKLNTSFLKKE